MRYYFVPKQVQEGEFGWTVSTSTTAEEHIKLEGRMPSNTIMFDCKTPNWCFFLHKSEGRWKYTADPIPDEINAYLLIMGFSV